MSEFHFSVFIYRHTGDQSIITTTYPIETKGSSLALIARGTFTLNEGDGLKDD